ncbi:MAG: hypothetical protein LBK73_01470 [Treponema sp.]|nr:hypothetical protein [Treponema sp.]
MKIEIADFLNGRPGFDMLVTTQEPKGVCALAQVYAKENAIPLELHFLNIKKYARGAFEHRSDEVIKSADFILLIHDGESQGTKNELERVKKFNKPYKYVKLDKSTELEREENSDILRENQPKEKPKKYDFFDL